MPHRIVTLALLTSLATLPALAAAATPTVSAVARVGTKVNINTASVKELQTLEGIGRNVAERIVQYREAHGPFKRGDDLKKVEGIGAATWEKNRARIVVK